MIYRQFKRLVEEVLSDMHAFSHDAVMAICMIVAHESKGCQYLWQYPNGPARGVIQMEEWVHDSVWQNADNILNNAARLGIVRNKKQLTRSLEYNIFMARQRLLMDINPLPTNAQDMSVYLKEYWNAGGEASPEEYLNDYMEWST